MQQFILPLGRHDGLITPLSLEKLLLAQNSILCQFLHSDELKAVMATIFAFNFLWMHFYRKVLGED